MTGVDVAPDAVCRLLDLLADDASGERLAHVAVAARAAGLDPAARAAVERATERALEIRHKLAEHRRREAELTALFDTARDLSKLRDLDEVLRSIVRRARMLLRVDLSYLSLDDEPAGAVRMRVAEGSASPLLRRLRIGYGEGLGGLVAQTASPYASADYLSDPRFRHTAQIDEAVAAEGMVGILGVPLSLGRKVIGVLFAADRARREFTPEEVALLSSLADHAAIAIDNAQRIEQARRANETISAHNEEMRRGEDAHDRLMALVLRGGDLTEVAAEVAAMLDGGIVLFDTDGVELARVGASEREPPAAVEHSSGRAVRHGDDWVCPMLAGPELLGSMALSGRPELGDADRRLFERAGLVAALLVLLRRSVAKAEDEVRGELLTDLLTAPSRNPDALLDRGRRLGIDLAAPHLVAIAHCPAVSRRRLAMAGRRHATLVGWHAEQVVLLVAGGSPQLAGSLAADLGSVVDAPVTVGVSGPARGPAALAAAAAEAARCVRALLALGRVGEGAALADLGFVGQLLGDSTDLDGYVLATLGPVLDYDARRGTDLVGTLRAYFDSGANLTRAKERLHVHVNTVAQRLERISSLLGADWQAPDRALEIQVALRLHRLHGR
ncbi:GAF domain-containing protein [Amycolatopsis arida]|uniref:GAF domain-containing protein n=1 Tax=Amycolatopsis arida TaxID=587909 RepID=A0A1I5LBM7_9PSEU|nr:GAF domain-containing protein [Amycolatopsis arida]TDX93665.1 GAF domain-containing protein [Amycolatopsis arida]SFO94774.1 GAF domain-containing protein [Amycolatopsis arida]